MPQQSSSSRDRRRKVVVVNDTKEILELFAELLEDLGLDVSVMTYAPDELTRIIAEHPDLLIVDFVLGGRETEGWQLIQKLRMHSATRHTPIIACTAALQVVREQEAYLLEQGVNVVLKPFTVEQLENAVRRAVEHPQAPGPRSTDPIGSAVDGGRD